MELFSDAEGFVKPIVFLIASLVILGVTYKKRTHYVWLSLAPIIGLFLYQSHIEEVQIKHQQTAYATEQWMQLYRPDMFHMTETTYTDSTDTDEWIIETEAGRYVIQFTSGQHSGFKVVRTLEEFEPLRGRRNVIDLLVLLELDGHLEFDGLDYTLFTEDDTYVIKMTDSHRVNHVERSGGDVIYVNEEENNEKNDSTGDYQ